MVAMFFSLLSFALPLAHAPARTLVHVAAAKLDEKSADADAARAKLAVAELDKAIRSADKDLKLKAIQMHGAVAHPEVARLLGRGARDKEPDIQGAAIQALRWLEHADAVKELHAVARAEKGLRKDPVGYARLLQAIGQHGDVSSIPVLVDDVATVPDYVVVQARILSLGRIRSVAAVEALLELMKVTGAQRIQNLMPDFRLALVRLSGVDKGESQPLWQEWWKAERVKLRIEAEPAELSLELQARWESYWGRGERYERARPRSSRGRGDPDKGP